MPRWVKLAGIAAGVLAALVGLYAFVGYRVAPNLVREQAQAYVSTEFGKQLKIGEIKTDPFGFKLEMSDIEIPDGERPMVAVKRLHVDFDFTSVVRESYRLDAITIDVPRINAVVRADGKLNLLELVPKPSEEPFPPVLIADLAVNSGEVRMTDLSREGSPQARLAPVTFALQNLHTLRDEGGNVRMTARSDEGEAFAWKGNVSMEPLASHGGLTIRGLRASSIQKFAGEMLPVALNDGRIDLDAAYAASYGDAGARLDLKLPRLTLAGFAGRTGAGMPGADVSVGGLDIGGTTLAVRVPEGGEPVTDLAVPRIVLTNLAVTGTGADAGQRLKAAAIAVTGIRGSPAAGAASLGGLALRDLALDLPRDVLNGSVKVGALDAPGGIRIDLATGPDGGTPTAMEMPALTIRTARMDGTGPAKGQYTTIDDVELAGIRYVPEGNIAAIETTRISGVTAVTDRDVNSRIGLLRLLPVSPAKAGAPNYRLGVRDVSVEKVRLRVIDHYVRPSIAYEITPVTVRAKGDGKDIYNPLDVDVSGKVNGRWGFAARGRIDAGTQAADVKLKLTDVPLAAAIPYAPPLPGVAITSGTLGVEGRARYAKAVPRFDGQVTVNRLRMIETARRSEILGWRSLALSGIDGSPKGATVKLVRLDGLVGSVAILEDGTFNFARIMEDNPAPVIAVGGAQPAKKLTRAEKRAEKARIANEKAATKAAAYAKLAAPMREPDIPVTIRRIELSRGTLAFADRSIEPNFAARIDALRGTIRNASNRPQAVSEIDLKGQVINQFSPVTIKGTIHPLAYDRRTKVDVAFRNIELPVFNPYSGRYAGYAIDKGKLTTELSYTIDNRALDAKHHIIIDQLEWGEATDSKEKVSLPVRMATSLMKDKNGVIDLDVPVTGTLDDPAFRVWPVIWKIVGNLATKIITAPFKAIGSLFGGGAEQAQFVDFAPGSAALPEGAAANLGELAKALGDKPGLKLDVPSGPAGELDAKAIADANIANAAMAKEVKKGGKADLAALKPGERHDRLKDLYKAKLKKSPEFPPAPAPDEKGDARKAREADWLLAELRPAFMPGAPELEKLGTERGEAVKNALLADGAIDPARVFISARESVSAQDGKARMELKLE